MGWDMSTSIFTEVISETDAIIFTGMGRGEGRGRSQTGYCRHQVGADSKLEQSHLYCHTGHTHTAVER